VYRLDDFVRVRSDDGECLQRTSSRGVGPEIPDTGETHQLPILTAKRPRFRIFPLWGIGADVPFVKEVCRHDAAVVLERLSKLAVGRDALSSCEVPFSALLGILRSVRNETLPHESEFTSAGLRVQPHDRLKSLRSYVVIGSEGEVRREPAELEHISDLLLLDLRT
jgi:hypothetical protein